MPERYTIKDSISTYGLRGAKIQQWVIGTLGSSVFIGMTDEPYSFFMKVSATFAFTFANVLANSTLDKVSPFSQMSFVTDIEALSYEELLLSGTGTSQMITPRSREAIDLWNCHITPLVPIYPGEANGTYLEFGFPGETNPLRISIDHCLKISLALMKTIRFAPDFEFYKCTLINTPEQVKSSYES